MKLYVVLHGGFLWDDGGDSPRAVCTSREIAERMVAEPQVWFTDRGRTHMCKPSDLRIVEVEADQWHPEDIRE